MDGTEGASGAEVRVAANHAVTKRLGNWTAARHFEVRTHCGLAVLDLRSQHIPAGDIRVEIDVDHAVLKLLVSDDAVVDTWNVKRIGRGRVKDREAPKTPGDRCITLSGQMRNGEIRVHRGGVAVLSAMWSREFLADLRRARRAGTRPTVADPAHTP